MQRWPPIKCREIKDHHTGNGDTTNGTIVRPQWLDKVEKFTVHTLAVSYASPMTFMFIMCVWKYKKENSANF